MAQRWPIEAGTDRKALIAELAALAHPERATFLRSFFKTGPGDYAEGDRFLGISVPAQRKIAQRYRYLPLADVRQLLGSPIHEERFCALAILVWQYEHADAAKQEQIYRFYLRNARRVNNWDLVDSSAPNIVGVHLRTRPQTELDDLAVSANIWERRIAIVSTQGLIKDGQVGSTFRIARILLNDSHDLIHKATGWMLREAGKVSEAKLVLFLRKNYRALPRTALRYAIERFPPERRKRMLAGDFAES